MHKAARNKGNEVSCPREPTKWCYRQTCCGSKALGNTYHLNCVCRMSKDSKLPQQNIPENFQDKWVPLDFGCWALGMQNCLSLGWIQCTFPSPEQGWEQQSFVNLSLAMQLTALCPLVPSTAFLGGTAPPQLCRGQLSQAGTNRGTRWGQAVGEKHVKCCLLLSSSLRIEQPFIIIESLPKTRQTLKRNPRKGWISEGRLKMSISAWWLQALAFQGFQAAVLVFISICRN